MPEWIDLAKKSLGPKDEILKSYPANFDGKDGYLVLSNRNVLFVKEEGFLKKTASLTLEVPYEKIGKVTGERRHITLIGDERHVIRSDYTGAITRLIESMLHKAKPASH